MISAARRCSPRVLSVAMVIVVASVISLVWLEQTSQARAAQPGHAVRAGQLAAHGRSGSVTTALRKSGRDVAQPSPAAVDPDNQGPGPEPAAVAGVRWSSGSMQVGQLRRAWWLATPLHPRFPRLPLLMVLHGRNSTPAGEASRTGFLSVVAAGDAIAAYPAGWDTSWNAGHCCGRAHAAGIDDLAFLHRLAAELTARPDVGAADLDLVGFSNGAKMAFDLVCSGQIKPRALVVAEAVPTSDCSHSPAVPLVQVAGTADPLVPYATVDPLLTADGRPLMPVLSDISDWAANNGCTSSTDVTQAQRLVQTWSGCRAPVELLTYPGGAHVWHSDVTSYLWNFLAEQAGPVT